MASIEKEGKKEEVKDGSSIKESCDRLGVLFACEDGICGTCLIEVLDGMKSLSPLSQAEKDFGVKENERLACQCKILKGKVKVKSKF